MAKNARLIFSAAASGWRVRFKVDNGIDWKSFPWWRVRIPSLNLISCLTSSHTMSLKSVCPVCSMTDCNRFTQSSDNPNTSGVIEGCVTSVVVAWDSWERNLINAFSWVLSANFSFDCSIFLSLSAILSINLTPGCPNLMPCRWPPADTIAPSPIW